MMGSGLMVCLWYLLCRCWKIDPFKDQQKSLILIQPHSGYVLQEAIKADAEFLAKSNIMDYSYVSSPLHHPSL